MADQGNEGYLSAFLRRQRIKQSVKFLFGKVLDVGCGSGLLAKYVPAPDYVGIEPDEPLWSLLNMARGKYWKSLGNTPGHIQKWSTASFRKVLQKYFIVEKTATPLPWTMCLCRPKDR